MIEVKLLTVPRDEDDTATDSVRSDTTASDKEIFILCRSQDRVKKDAAIMRRFEQKIEERLRAMATRCQKQRRDVQKVEREVGRMLGQNTRAARLFEVKVERREDGGALLQWKKIEDVRDWATLSAGCYLLRTNVLDWTDAELWKTYMQLTEAEAAFKIHKTDLSIRPIWHQKENRVLAHILVCFLGYVLWKTLGQLCRQAGLTGWETNRAACWMSSQRYALSTSFSLRGRASKSVNAVSLVRQNTNKSCSTGRGRFIRALTSSATNTLSGYVLWW